MLDDCSETSNPDEARRLRGRDHFLEIREVSQGIEMRIPARLVQQIVGGGIALKPLGTQIERLVEVLQGRFGLSQYGFEGAEVVPRFGLFGNKGDEFLEDAFEFAQVANFSVSLGNKAGFVGSDMRVGQRPIEQFNRPVGLLHLQVDAGESQEILQISRVCLRFIFHVLDLGFDLGAVGRLIFDIPQLFHEPLHLVVVGVKFLTGTGDEERIVNAAKLE